MSTHRVDLLVGEKVLFDSEPAVLTNRRLMANWKGGEGGGPSDEALLSDIVGFEKIDGGRERRLGRGLAIGAGGVVVVALAELIPELSSIIEGTIFLIGSVVAILGLYAILGDLLHMRPHTTIFFEVLGEGPIVVTFPGRSNPKADELTRLHVRAKRVL